MQHKSELIKEDTQRIDLRRWHIWEDTLRALRKATFDSRKTLMLRFVGEPAVDDGGPCREFLTLAIRALTDSPLLIGNFNQKVFSYSTQAIVNRTFFAGR